MAKGETGLEGGIDLYIDGELLYIDGELDRDGVPWDSAMAPTLKGEGAGR